MKATATQNYSPITITVTLETEREKLLWLALLNLPGVEIQVRNMVNKVYLNLNELQADLKEVGEFIDQLNHATDI